MQLLHLLFFEIIFLSLKMTLTYLIHHPNFQLISISFTFFSPLMLKVFLLLMQLVISSTPFFLLLLFLKVHFEYSKFSK